MVSIVLCTPSVPGNIGAVARTMNNFGFTDLRLVNPCELDDSAFARAMHSKFILKNAKIYSDLNSAVRDSSLVIGTSSVINENRKNKIRNPLTAESFFSSCEYIDDKTSIVFGCEEFGLLQHELRRCDVLLTIPANEDYPIMNLSHATAIILYELTRKHGLGGRDVKESHISNMGIRSESSTSERELFISKVSELMQTINYPVYKRNNVLVTFRRLLGRSGFTRDEFHILLGIITRSDKHIRRLRKNLYNDSMVEDE